jgi:hypothetical protein
MRAVTSFLILVSSLLAVVSAFTVQQIGRTPAHPSSPETRRQRRSHSCRLHSNRDEEIAKLEAQLRQLKDEEDTAATTDTTVTERKKVVERRILEKVKGKDMLLSERELVEERLFLAAENDASSSGDLGVIPTVVAALGLAIFLGFFAQLPVGQDTFSRYSAPSGPTTSTSIDLGDMNSDIKK